jgi:hypothetical protein
LDLWRQAEDGTKDILAQFQIDETQIDEIIGIFQDYMTASSFNLRIKSIPRKIAMHGELWNVTIIHQVTLSDIALRIETPVRNEAVSEWTNGTMSRLLAPLRLRMGRETLLLRLILSKHSDSERHPE